MKRKTEIIRQSLEYSGGEKEWMENIGSCHTQKQGDQGRGAEGGEKKQGGRQGRREVERQGGRKGSRQGGREGRRVGLLLPT